MASQVWLPQQRGPKGGHKISAEVLAYVDELKAATPDLTHAAMCRRNRQRALASRCTDEAWSGRWRAKKNDIGSLVAADAARIVDAYERLRAAVLGAEPVRWRRIRRHCAAKAWRRGSRQRDLEHGSAAALRCRLADRQPRARSRASELTRHPRQPRRHACRGARPCLISRVTADHLQRDAYLYVRQSTLRQVAENGESTQRQYALRDRAIAAGWPAERIHVIDCDLGKSGASAVARDGFQELVSEVALAKAGIVMGLEVSRLARNSADWHRLHRAVRADRHPHPRRRRRLRSRQLQ